MATNVFASLIVAFFVFSYVIGSPQIATVSDIIIRGNPIQCFKNESKTISCGNGCGCTNGTWICTLRGCYPESNPKQCTYGEISVRGFQNCRCDKDGYWACTRQC